MIIITAVGIAKIVALMGLALVVSGVLIGFGTLARILHDMDED
jgi:hypothetical protein